MFEQPVENPQQTFVNGANLAPPKFGTSFVNGLASSLIAPNAAIEDIGHAISKTPGDGWAQNALDYYNAQQDISGSSGFGSFAGSTLGFLISPETGAIATGTVKVGAKLLASQGLSRLGSAATTSLASGAGFAATMAPYTIPDNYKPNDGSIDWGGTAKTLGVYGGIGMALPLLPFAAGIAISKVKDWKAANAIAPEAEAAAEAPVSGAASNDLDAAKEAGAITPEEHALMTALNNKEAVDPNLVKKVADANGVKYSPSLHVDVPLANGEDLQNIQKTAPDELATATPDTVPEQVSPMSDHILNNRINDIAQNPSMVDGIQGFADHMDRALENKDTYLDSIDNAADTTAGIDRDHPLSQDSLFKAAQDEKLMRENLPYEVQSALNHEDKVQKSQKIVENRTKQLNRDGLTKSQISDRQARLDKSQANLDDLKDNRPSLLAPDEELGALRKRLLDGSDLNTADKLGDMQRLDDLAHVSEGAQRLRDRVDLEGQYQKQAAMSTVAKAVVQKARDGVDMQASSQRVMDYLKNKTQEKVKKFSEEKTAPPKTDATFDSLATEATTPEAKQAVLSAKAKADAIDTEQNILTNAINCVMGLGT